jgi:hypothetical protein
MLPEPKRANLVDKRQVVLDSSKDSNSSNLSGLSVDKSVEVIDTKKGKQSKNRGFKKNKREEREIKVPVCSDYVDNNINYYKKGLCKDESKKKMKRNTEDYCSNDGMTLMEYSCGTTNFCEGSWYVCANGCEDGACLTEKREELKPDLKVLSLVNEFDSSSVSVKNVGTKGTYFKTKIKILENEETLDVDYYLEPGEVVEVDLGDKISENYSVSVIADEDENLEDNVLETTPSAITGAVISDSPKEQKKPFEGPTLFNRFINFFKNKFF